MKPAKQAQLNLLRGFVGFVVLALLLVWWWIKSTSTVDYVETAILSQADALTDLKIIPASKQQIALAEANRDKDLFIQHVDTDQLKNLKTVYVIPGGGSSHDIGYPEWTKRRVNAAYDHYIRNSNQASSIFLSLSAGSLNSPNVLFNDGRIMFECQHMILHLIDKGVPKSRIYGDMTSWDTVGNGYVLRTFLEGVLLYKDILAPEPEVSSRRIEEQQEIKPSELLNIEVFISDFHALRVKETFAWMLELLPSLSDRVRLNIHSVDSIGIKWYSEQEFQARVRHEEVGVERIKENKRHIKTVNQFHAFSLLGGHQGYRKYLLNEYVKSEGGGW